MKRSIFVIATVLSFASVRLYSQTGFNGSWITMDFANGATGTAQPNIIDLKVEGTKLTGTVSRAQQIVDIEEGMVNGNTITFKVTFAGGGRINTYTGKLNGNVIDFTRSVKVRDEASNNGAGIFGAQGAMKFTAKRDANALNAMFFGNWKTNLQKSKFDPGPAPQSVTPQVRQYVTHGNGEFAFLSIGANAQGVPNFTQAILKADGKDYPVGLPATALAQLQGEKPTFNNTMSAKSIDARTLEITAKAANVVTSIARISVSADGRTLSETVKVMDATGKTTANNVMIFEKQ